MKTLVIEAPAKINLCLHVLGRREDGYHELAMAMQRISLADRLEVSLAAGEGIGLECDGFDVGAGDNIACRAAELFLRTAGVSGRVDIRMTKRIPVAAGLGGGSSDAAAVLAALNRLCDTPLAGKDLMALAAELGADVPFFLFERPAWATGTGTCLQELPSLPSVCYLVLNPGFAVSTAWVYQSLRLTKGGELANLPRFSVATTADLLAALHNDLEAVTAGRHPEINAMKDFLLANGALGALMSGSGASVFGVFADRGAAEMARLALPAECSWFSAVALPL